ncbi:MAG: right-handed parallel beta-helix repeat-containing protein [Gammaproteobacteria bacterium]|nr:right-handed parallel beta-helix repeat-containing protein [Gammaproteobacteria bacterium]MDH5801828.1 right-handed parallel beta-helix repeat-containing protein [Gammaproteobacteria bacterium]
MSINPGSHISRSLAVSAMLLLAGCGGGGGGTGPTNSAPVISGTPAIVGTEEAAYSDSALSASDADGQSVTWTIIGPAWLAIDSNTGALAGTPANSDVGQNDFTITAADGVGGEDTLLLSIDVAEVNDLPTLSMTIPNHGVFDGFGSWNVDLATWMVDVDTTQTPVYTVEANTDATTITTAIVGSTLTLTQASLNSPVVSLTVRLTDGGSAAFVEDTFDVVISTRTYTNSNWNEYVKNDGADVFSATDTACDGTETGGYDACVHAAEIIEIDTGLTTACGGLSAADTMSAFAWVCDDSGLTTVYRTSGLATGKGLGDLINFSGAPAWKNHSLVVTGGDGFLSRPHPWYSNTIVEDNDGMAGGAVAGTIYVVTADPATSYTLDAGKVGFVVAPGVTMTGPVTGGSNLVFLNTQNFLWIEGEMDGTASPANNPILLVSTKFSVARLNTITNADYGIQLNASSNNLIDQANIDGSVTVGIELFSGSTNNTISNGVISNSTSKGMLVSASNSNQISDMNFSFNGGVGLELSFSTNNVLTNITASNNGTNGVHVNNFSSNNTLTNIDVSGNYYGLYVYNSNSNEILDVVAHANTNSGVYLQLTSFNVVNNIGAKNNTSNGIALTAAHDNTINNVRAINSTNGVQMSSSDRNLITNVIASGSNSGISLSVGVDNVLMGITATGSNFGFAVDNFAANNVFAGVTATNNVSIGIIAQGSDNTFLQTAAANNYYGYYLGNANNLFHSTLATHSNTGIYLTTGADNNQFSGSLMVGDNSVGDCFVIAESTATGGLWDDAGGVDATHDGVCVAAVPSDFGSPTTGVSVASSFVGKLSTDDLANTSDTNGIASYPADPSTFDWLNYENAYRLWGREGGAFPSTGGQGAFTFGNGAIWDWSLLNNDTVMLGAMAVPTGNDIISHTWSTTSSTTFLLSAIEISGDAVGNDNLLCESNEVCLYAPNLGSYQGHGTIGAGPAFVDGTITGVTLMQYGTNGY